MIALRFLPLLVVLAVLTGCAGTPPLSQVQRNESANSAHASIGTELQPDVKNPKRKHAVSKSKPRPAATASASAASASAASASAASGNEMLSPTTPSVGSPEWEREKAYNERKEQKIKQVIEGICRGC